VLTALSPALITTRPPADESPLPTDTLKLPDTPVVAEPVRTTIDPLLPFVVTPDFKDTAPLTPLVPASALRKLNAPLLDEVL